MIRYILLVNLYSGLLYFLYTVLLKNRTRHTWSRYYLLLTCVLSLVLPFIQPSLNIWQTAAQPLKTIVALPELTVGAGGSGSTATAGSWLLLLYITIASLLLMRLAFRLRRLHHFFSRLQFRQQGSYRIAVNTGLGPASFGNKIIFPEADIDPMILRHEQAHLHHRHHYDKTGMALLQCLCFPILPFYLIGPELEAVHEFEADADAATRPDHYAATLLSAHLGLRQLPHLQSFFHPPLKRRIIMLQQEKKQDRGRHTALLILTGFMIAGITVLQSKASAIAHMGTAGHELSDAAPANPYEKDAPAALPDRKEETDGESSLSPQDQAGENATASDQQNVPGSTEEVENSSAPSGPDDEQDAPAAQQPEKKSNPDDKVYTTVEILPEFPGGMGALQQYLADNVRYPEAARKAGMEGKVYARFIINESGGLDNITIVKDVAPESGCGAEVIRVLKAMPAWKPGMQGGEKKKVSYVIPVNFRLDKKK